MLIRESISFERGRNPKETLFSGFQPGDIYIHEAYDPVYSRTERIPFVFMCIPDNWGYLIGEFLEKNGKLRFKKCKGSSHPWPMDRKCSNEEWELLSRYFSSPEGKKIKEELFDITGIMINI